MERQESGNASARRRQGRQTTLDTRRQYPNIWPDRKARALDQLKDPRGGGEGGRGLAYSNVRLRPRIIHKRALRRASDVQSASVSTRHKHLPRLHSTYLPGDLVPGTFFKMTESCVYRMAAFLLSIRRFVPTDSFFLFRLYFCHRETKEDDQSRRGGVYFFFLLLRL